MTEIKKHKNLSVVSKNVNKPVEEDEYIPPFSRQENFPKNPTYYSMTHQEVQEFIDFVRAESAREKTPEEVHQHFYDLGMIDKHGEIVPGNEDLFRYLDYITKKRESNK